MTRREAVARRRLVAIFAALLVGAVIVALVSSGGGRPTSLARSRSVPSERSKRARTRGPAPTVPLPSLRRQIGQRLMVAFHGYQASAYLLRRARAGEIGGVILFSENIASAAQVRALTRSLQSAARAGGNPPLLVATDQEGGSVRRFSAAPPADGPPAMSATGNPQVAYTEGAAAGRFLRSTGVNLDLAPVVDLGSAGSFIDAEGRSFGSHPETVAKYASAFLRGLHAGGVMGTAKHFPGVGAAAVDTDYQLDRLPLSAAALVPYRRLIKDHVDAVMLATAAYPRLDPSGRPAALSARTEVLLRSLGFDGLTITDALESPTGLDPSSTALAAAQSGADILLYAQGDGGDAFQALLQAAGSGDLPRAAIAAAYRHVMQVKARLVSSGRLAAP